MPKPSAIEHRNLLLKGILLIFGSAFMTACSDGGGDGFAPPPPPDGGTGIATQRAYAALAFNQPVAMIQRPGNDTRWYVVQRGGLIYSFPNDPNVAPTDIVTFANLSSILSTGGGETGLLGVAFHPNFAVNGEVYVSYTGSSGGLVSRISRFVSLDGGVTLVTASEDILLTMSQPDNNHNGGQVAFGPDGFLYAGFGDGGGTGDPLDNGQDTTNLFGTIIRINVNGGGAYNIPVDNPFAGTPRCTTGVGVADCPEIFAWGFRNPWRWSFDRLNGNLWVGDVGQANWEEIDRVDIGMNYGWNLREGAHCYPAGSTGCSTAPVDPITEYSHSQGISVTGGYVYRGMDIPDLAGTYVFGDFGSGRIWGVPFDSSQGTAPEELLDTTFSISSFAEDADGELFLLDYGSGQVHRIINAP